MKEFFQDKDRKKGLIGTIIFHAIMLLAFILMGLTHMVPIPIDGFEVDFGDYEDGAPPIHNEVVEAQETHEEAPTEIPTEAPVEGDEIMHDETSEIAVPDKEEVKPKKKPEEKKPDDPKPVVEEPVKVEEPKPTINPALARMLEKMKQNNSDNAGSGENGTKDDVGDAGHPNSNESPIKDGAPGLGTSFSLGNRKSTHLPIPSSSIQEEGKIIVDIKVDRNGNVIWARAGARGSTITNIGLSKKAEAAAYKAKFSIDKLAAEEQKGSITYQFVLN
ncbi:MAG: hypothetical protein HRT71_07565 [Flavobacteriales bacterium]|nr:hypothetical protein [Flavobacteriales bacterium]